MNFNLIKIPERSVYPRQVGITGICDNGLSIVEAQNVLSIGSPFIDFVKLAFGSAMVTPQLSEKIKLYRSFNIPVYFGGLLLEAFIIRNQFDDYLKILDKYEITLIEVSDGYLDIPHRKKCEFIRTLSTKGKVISVIGSKNKDQLLVTPAYKWVELIKAELDAGSEYIVAEAKESGTEGLYRNSGEVREGLVEELLTKIPAKNIIWETPQKEQQLYFIKRLGCNANLGNIPPKEIIALEAMRIGLRGDSFDFFLN